jgi:hypothetical protein
MEVYWKARPPTFFWPFELYGPVHPAYNLYFLTCFFSRNSVFLSQQISQQCFSASLSAQPNGAYMLLVSSLEVIL